MYTVPQLDRLIDDALAEDIGLGDLTTTLLVPAGQGGRAKVIAKQPAVLAGLEVFRRVFQRLDQAVEVTGLKADGERLSGGEVVATLAGPLGPILSGERVALNLLQRLSGVATLTRRFVDALPEGSKTRVVDTRKTTPGLRALERYAVRCGGGASHRPRLDGGVLIKDNHIAACGSLPEAVRRARAALGPALRVEVETTTLAEVEQALAAGAEVIMLDNMSLDLVRSAVALIGGRALVEVSGNLSPERVPALADLGVDFLSVGALTHSAPAVDLSLLVATC